MCYVKKKSKKKNFNKFLNKKYHIKYRKHETKLVFITCEN
jgi:hypothetical protein